jgi:hypothetical protein
VLSGFREPLLTPFAGGKDAHFLEPCAHWQIVVKGEPGENIDFVQTSVVPHPRDDLGESGVA